MRFLSSFIKWPAKNQADASLKDAEEIRKLILADQSIGSVSVTESTALRHSAVFACIRILSNPIATTPIRIKNRKGEAKVLNEEHSLWRVLNRRPNKYQTPDLFRRKMMFDVLLRGDSMAQIRRDVKGNIIGLYPLDRNRVQVVQNDDLSLSFKYTKAKGGQTIFEHKDIFRLVGFSIDGVNAVSPLTFARESVGLALTQERHGADVYKNGINSALALATKDKLSDQAIKRLKKDLEDFKVNGLKSGEAMVLEEGLEPKALGMTMADAQWLESRKFSTSQIAQFYGVPPHMIGETEKQTSYGTGIEQQGIGYQTFSLEHYLSMFEDAVNFMVEEEDPNFCCEFDRSEITKIPFDALSSGLNKVVSGSILTIDEGRAKLGYNPLPNGEGKQRLLPPNYSGKQQENNPQENSNVVALSSRTKTN